MMEKRLYKTYTGLTNIIIRVSNGTLAKKEYSVLVNAHPIAHYPLPVQQIMRLSGSNAFSPSCISRLDTCLFYSVL